ncbi:hypothetical protein BC834DRAFT_847372 [Gloeopeniophorella convolvens]|nr:hypothetical protein BC834DRAFT_847372 [Gloeopeniophorella convolvens]
MSSLPPEQAPGPHGLKQLFDQALDKYTSITGTNLVLDPLASTLRGSNSVDAVIKVYQDQFERFRHLGKKGKVIAALKPVVEVMLALSNVGGILGDALGSALPPAKAVLGGIGVLLQQRKSVRATMPSSVFLKRSATFSSVSRSILMGHTASHLE